MFTVNYLKKSVDILVQVISKHFMFTVNIKTIIPDIVDV